MDSIDSKILRALQKDSNRAVSDLASDVGLSTSACHRRIKLLEESGVIAGYAARLDREALGLWVQAFVEITLSSQSESALNAFEKEVARFDEILECYLTTGQADYVLRVVAKNVADFDSIHRNCLAQLPGVSSMQTIFVLRSIQPWRGYPVRA